MRFYSMVSKQKKMCEFVSTFCWQVCETLAGHFSLVMLFSLSVATVSSTACPDRCVCSATVVKCQNQDLNKIPQPLPSNVKSLFVTGNNIVRLTNESFPELLDQLTHLHLNGNRIEQVDSNVFDNLPNLLSINISNNRITAFSPDAFPQGSRLQDLAMSRALRNRSPMVQVTALFSGSLSGLSRLDLSSNNLVVLPDGLFSSMANLTELSLRNNSLIGLQTLALPGGALRRLDLRDNALKHLSNQTVWALGRREDGHDGVRVLLEGNPWLCDCSADALLAWVQQHRAVADRWNLTCAAPERLRHAALMELPRSALPCAFAGDLQGVLESSYVWLGLVLALIGLIFLLVLYLNRKGIKKWLFNFRDACRDHMEGYHYRYEVSGDPRLASLNSDL